MPKRADLIPPVYRPSILVTHVAISIAKLFDCGYACAVISAADDIVFPKLLLLTFVRLSRIMHRKQHKEEMKVRYLLKNAKFFSQGVFHLADVFLSDGKIVSIGDGVSPSNDTIVIDISNMVLFPGFVDVHVHLREPGFSYKETIRTGTLAAAHGGFAHVADMPNPVSYTHLTLPTN